MKYFQLIFSIFYFSTLFQPFFFLVHKGFSKKVCRGTQKGFSHNKGSLELMRSIYTNCTYVDGNLELVFIDDPSTDLSFLKDIREVTGYVLISICYVPSIPLHNLRVIRGRSLYNHQEKYYSLYISNNFDPQNPSTVGLKELPFVSLHEIQSGSVYIGRNNVLCHLDDILWEDIVTGEGSSVTIENSHPDHVQRQCEQCDEACEVQGRRHCWGDGPNQCQKLNKALCSKQCDGQCFGSKPSECCDVECIGGCKGPSKTQCWACKNFDDDGSCKKFCPSEFVYDPLQFRQVPNPGLKYSYGTLCVNKCPEHMNSQKGACVLDCGDGMLPDAHRKCVPCDGPCPKTCKLEEDLEASNIDSLEGCTVISGSINLLGTAFTGDPFMKIPPLNTSQLYAMSSVKEVTGYVKVQVNELTLTNLSFLSNLHTIHGQKTDRIGASLHIFGTSLESLGLDSLKKITNGGVFIGSNKELCYAEKINWAALHFNTTKTKFKITKNKPFETCRKNGEVCNSECSKDGCWGPLSSQCLSCKTYSLHGPHGFIKCVSSCDVEAGMYTSSKNTCKACHEQCLSNCYGPGSDQCDKCKVAKDGPYCKDKCPSRKYLDSSGICRDCHEYCDDQGCKGPRPDQSLEGCIACQLPLVANISSKQAMCLPPKSKCPSEYFFRPTRAACIKCHSECSSCNGSSLEDCLSCKHYNISNTCVAACPISHFEIENLKKEKFCEGCDTRCMGCDGSSNYNCTACKQYKVYYNTDEFYCAEKCPDDKPEASVNNTEIICLPINYKERQSMIIGTSGVVLVVLLFISSIISCLCVKRKKAKENLAKAQESMKNISNGKEMIGLIPSRIEPDISKLILVKKSDLDIGNMIGSGAYGTVCKGFWKSEKQEVAIKILNEGSEQLLSEARIMATVKHENCIRILCVCLTKRLMLVTPLMKLGCMLDYIRKQPQRLTSSMVLKWSQQIAKGMHHLESKEIVHCDLAARNVLVESFEQVKITDFGLAKLVTGKNDLSTPDAINCALKLPVKWLAYESLISKMFTHKSDVWSYGVTIWELCTFGDRPYRDIGDFKAIPNYLKQGHRLKRPFICSPEFYSLLFQCWNIEPETRPSFEELVIQLQHMKTQPSRYINIKNSSPQTPNNMGYLPLSAQNSLDNTLYVNSPTEEKPYIPCEIPQPKFVPEIQSSYYNHFGPGFLNKPLNYRHYKTPTSTLSNCTSKNTSQTHIPNNSQNVSTIDHRSSFHSSTSFNSESHDYYNTYTFKQ